MRTSNFFFQPNEMTELKPANQAAKAFNIEASALTKYIQPCPLIQPLPSAATSYEKIANKAI